MNRRLWLVIRHTWSGYNRDNCNQLAAAISYYVLFSVVPLAILGVTIFGIVVRDQSLKNDVIDSIVNAFSLSDTDGRSAVRDAIDGIQSASGLAVVVGVLGALWTSSAVFGSIRRSLNAVWGVYERRSYLQAKLVDFLQMGALGLLFVASIALTGFVRVVRDESGRFGGPLSSHNALWEIPAFAVPAAITFVALVALYVLVPTARPRARDAWVGALAATLMFEAVKNAFAFYVSHFNNFNVIYGSLAGVFLFLFSTFLASNVLLIGAEVARSVGELRSGAYDAELAPGRAQPPIAARALRLVKGIFVRQ